jgi:1-pyrroline-4-hydroxy-2-carboxylate deaminase
MAFEGGLYCAVITPFGEDGGVDHGKLRAHCEWMVEQGVEGIVANGGVGEYKALERDERGRVVATVVEAANGRVPVLAGSGAPTGDQARFWAEQARDAGAVAVQASAPYGYTPTRAEIVTHYEELAKAEIDVVLYNNTTDTTTDLTPELVAELSAIDRVVGIKEFSGDVRRIAHLREAAPELVVLCGCDDMILESMAAGAHGWIGGFPNVYPDVCRRLLDLLRADRVAEARELYVRYLPLFRWDSHAFYVQAIKLAMDLEGLGGGPLRLPRRPLVGAPADAVQQAVKSIQAQP